MMIPLSRGLAIEDQPICAAIRAVGVQEFMDGATCRGLIAMKLPADGMIVRSIAEIADAFAVSAATVKNHWRESGMPGKSGRWDLGEILSWRLARDARAKGFTIDETPIDIQVDRAFARLVDDWGIAHVIAAGERLSKSWSETLAACEAEDNAAKRRKPSTRKEAK